MRPILSEELKDLQMQIMDYVDSFCRENNIKYTLSGGTLLGAVRHGGFIPWDDDIDIQMVRSEYLKFTQLWKEKGEHSVYELVNIESGNNIGYPFGKVHQVKTATYVGRLKRTGVFIDIFPMDKVMDEMDFIKRRTDIEKMYRFRTYIFRLLCRFPNIMILKKAYQHISESINELASVKEKIDCNYVFEMTSGLLCKTFIPKEVFETYDDIHFEDRTYMAIKDYDTYLKCTFGDYMTLPPEDKRVSHHEFVAYWQ